MTNRDKLHDFRASRTSSAGCPSLSWSSMTTSPPALSLLFSSSSSCQKDSQACSLHPAVRALFAQVLPKAASLKRWHALRNVAATHTSSAYIIRTSLPRMSSLRCAGTPGSRFPCKLCFQAAFTSPASTGISGGFENTAVNLVFCLIRREVISDPTMQRHNRPKPSATSSLRKSSARRGSVSILGKGTRNTRSGACCALARVDRIRCNARGLP
mmetsp:Transcript_66518/g.155996  ORF Transcript_66518/g.155996 Transcript_66518/m.155996 type:complete len:213 (-) Transcript_66518:63-701(-)